MHQRFLSLVSSLATYGKSHNFTTHFQPALDFSDGEYSVALISALVPYTFFNISSALGNNNFHFTNNGVPATISFPDGSYSVDAINNYIKGVLGPNVIQVLTDLNRLRVYLVISTNYTVDFTFNDTFRSLLGFNSGVYNAGTVYAQNEPDITNGNDSFYIICDLVDSSASSIGPIRSPVLYGFDFTVGQGSAQELIPTERVHLPIAKSYCSDVTVQIVNQNGQLVDLNNEKVVVNMVITKEASKD